MQPFSMALPKNVAEASRASAAGHDQARLLAGGTDLLSELKDNIATPEVVVNLKRVAGLDQIVIDDTGAEIGALVTLNQLAEHAGIRKTWPIIAQSLERTATPSLRNVGTVGGNLCQRPRCWYYRHPEYACLKKGGSTCYAQQGENEFHSVFGNLICAAVHPSNLGPAFMVHDAEIEIARGDSTRWVPIGEFFVTPEQDVTAENILKPGDVVTRVRLPKGASSTYAAYVEVREKESFDWASVGAAVRLTWGKGGSVAAARVVLSAVAPVPMRRTDLEEMLTARAPKGEVVNLDERLRKILDRAVTGARPLAQNKYKLALIRATLRRALAQAEKGGK